MADEPEEDDELEDEEENGDSLKYLFAIIDKLLEKSGDAEKIIRAWSEHSRGYRQIDQGTRKVIIFSLIMIFGLVVLASAYLTQVGKLDSSGYAFIVGTMVGALITLFRDFVVSYK